MNFFMSLLAVLLIIFVILGIALMIVFIRLGRELQRLGDSTETMLAKTQRAVRTVQVLIPAVALIKKFSNRFSKRQTMNTQKGARSHVKANRKKA